MLSRVAFDVKQRTFNATSYTFNTRLHKTLQAFGINLDSKISIRSNESFFTFVVMFVFGGKKR